MFSDVSLVAGRHVASLDAALPPGWLSRHLEPSLVFSHGLTAGTFAAQLAGTGRRG